jgi:hypothetical protein
MILAPVSAFCENQVTLRTSLSAGYCTLFRVQYLAEFLSKRAAQKMRNGRSEWVTTVSTLMCFILCVQLLSRPAFVHLLTEVCISAAHYRSSLLKLFALLVSQTL